MGMPPARTGTRSPGDTGAGSSPARACATRSYAGASARGPVLPNELTTPTTAAGCAACTASQSSPNRFARSGRKLWRSTSVDSSRRRLASRPRSVLRSRTTERFPRLSGRKYLPTPGATGMTWRYASPPGGSTLMTSAPRSARGTPHRGPATYCAYSRTLTPSSGGVTEAPAHAAR